jgi:hypothetical protein
MGVIFSWHFSQSEGTALINGEVNAKIKHKAISAKRCFLMDMMPPFRA